MLERERYPANPLIRVPLTFFLFCGLVGSWSVRYVNYTLLVMLLVINLISFLSFSLAKWAFFTYLTLMTFVILANACYIQLLSSRARKRGSPQLLYENKNISGLVIGAGDFWVINLIVGFIYLGRAVGEAGGINSESLLFWVKLYAIFFIMLPMALPLIIRFIYAGGNRASLNVIKSDKDHEGESPA